MIKMSLIVILFISCFGLDELGNYILNTERKIDPGWWINKYNDAEKYMKMRRTNENGSKIQNGSYILMVSTSQHPLIKDIYGKRTLVGHEFKERLDKIYQISKMCKDQLYEFYIPASIHKDDNGIVDDISTSSAAENYLIFLGINPDVIHGDDLNLKYKGDDGVYNSADESFVATQYFKDNEKFKDIIVACSPDQQLRWELHSVANGVLPTFYEVQTIESKQRTKHGRGGVLDPTLFYTLFYDPLFNDSDSLLRKISREIRKP